MPLAPVTGTGAIPRAALAYRPGATSPLRAVVGQLAECVEGEAGAVVVDLVRSTSGATVATAHGGTERVRWCVEGVARTLTLDRDAQRCSLAYGALALDEVPAVDVARTGASWRGAPIDLEPLREAVTSFFDDASTRQLVARGPVVVRAAADAPIAQVDAVLTALAGFEPVLAVGPPWHLVESVTLPVVPVPLGSGGLAWDAAPAAPYALVLERFVEVGPPAERPPRDQLVEVLRRLHARAPSETALLVIARDVPYGEVVRTIEAAQTAGFTDWHHEPEAPP